MSFLSKETMRVIGRTVEPGLQHQNFRLNGNGSNVTLSYEVKRKSSARGNKAV
jgi:hypothetical protein